MEFKKTIDDDDIHDLASDIVDYFIKNRYRIKYVKNIIEKKKMIEEKDIEGEKNKTEEKNLDYDEIQDKIYEIIASFFKEIYKDIDFLWHVGYNSENDYFHDTIYDICHLFNTYDEQSDGYEKIQDQIDKTMWRHVLYGLINIAPDNEELDDEYSDYEESVEV